MTGYVGKRVRRVALPLALVLAASAALVNPATIVAGTGGRDDDWWARSAMQMIAPIAQGIDRLAGVQAVSTGSDGRLTFLLLGSDSRGTGLSRMDTIMIASIKGKQISLASIPRDTARVPNPFSGGTFSGKINAIVRQFLHAGYSSTAALARFEIVIERLLQIEIDYRAVVWFNGLTTLVGKVDPINVRIPREIRDPHMRDDKSGDVRAGLYFPASTSYQLYDFNRSGRPYCNGAYRSLSGAIPSSYWCHRALAFVRSRKGPKNNDWIRAQRQQGFIASAIKAVSSFELSGLVSTAANQGGGKWITNMPVTIGNATDLYNRFQGAYLASSVVFKPYTYASKVTGTSGWALKLPAVRAWTRAYMK